MRPSSRAELTAPFANARAGVRDPSTASPAIRRTLCARGVRTMTPLPIAHAGHWFEGALYLAPVVILVVVLFLQGRKDDHADEAEHGEPQP